MIYSFTLDLMNSCCMSLPNWPSVCLCSRSFTFVIPVWKEGSVGDRMVYGSLLAFVNNVMWAMYAASDSLESKLYFFIVNGVGLVFQICYNILYIYYAEGKKSIQAFILLLASYVVALVMAALVPWMVMTQRWSSTWVGVLAASFGVSIHIASAWDMASVQRPVKCMHCLP